MKAYNFINNEGWPQEAGVEPRGNAGALSDPSASVSVQDDSERKGERLLEAIGRLRRIALDTAQP
jgi:hypothetical protein